MNVCSGQILGIFLAIYQKSKGFQFMLVESKVKDQQLIDDKRRQIIEGAIRVFQEKGYHKATVREIAEEAKIGLGSIYDYVKSKDDILYLFFENYCSAFYGKVKEKCPPQQDPLSRLEIAYRAFVESAMELDDQVMLAYTQAKYVRQDYLRIILRRESEIVEYFQRIIEEALDGKGEMDPFVEANFLVYSGVFGVIRRWILKPRYKGEQIIDYLVKTQAGALIQRVMSIRGDREE
jgi:TetR/AcrR family transcriptional regulator, cholesterol catabolism regulator